MEKNSPKIMNIRFESSDKDKFFDIVENLLKKNEHCNRGRQDYLILKLR